ncbi:hypothetical protein [Flammeovirga kamogawensis]|uniref:Uncharacterized protein n=1 Tax=Flammeovirga kamogawensis TaxID=373891 RepID=A0ABX8H137_9BACT|nr:hypothetical protein [Flammeovirga kamogawensis]MBB6462655.1 hypothetical protein [Flammeovirga kamogawensis]QWG09601.1 hypothetical protein KM029_23645 [Flammeovirga kamogawensis]TRX65116.1 hypothetical protein EO216_21545 [Flammeovirga kamogawensis]
MQISLLLVLFSILFAPSDQPAKDKVLSTLKHSNSDYLPYNVDVISTAYGSSEYVNLTGRVVHASSDFYAIDYLDKDWEMQVHNANKDYSGLPFFKSKIRRDLIELLNEPTNSVEIEEVVYLGLSSYLVTIKEEDRKIPNVYSKNQDGNNDTSMSNIMNIWTKFYISKEGLLLRYESHSQASGNKVDNKQRDVVKFYIQEN